MKQTKQLQEIAVIIAGNVITNTIEDNEKKIIPFNYKALYHESNI